MRRAMERGLAVADLENMTIGMVLDFLVEYRNEEISQSEQPSDSRYATQDDIDAF